MKMLYIFIVTIVTLVALIIILNRFDAQINSFIAKPLIPRYFTKEAKYFQSFKPYNSTASADRETLAKKMNWTIKYEGLENVPKDKPFILIANETSNYDGCLLVDMLNRVRFEPDAKMICINRWDWTADYCMKLIKYHEVKHSFAPNGVQKVLGQLEEGPLVIFPSGRFDNRLFDLGDYFKFKSGFLWFARDAKVDIIPARINMRTPFIIKLLNSIMPITMENLQTLLFFDLYLNKVITITVGEPISINTILQDDLSSKTGFSRAILKKYERQVFGLGK